MRFSTPHSSRSFKFIVQSSAQISGMKLSVDRDIVDIDDGHVPGVSAVTTKIAIYKGKQSKDFFAIFDNLLPDSVCSEAYEYAVVRNRPWGKTLLFICRGLLRSGAYVSTSDALDVNLTPESLKAQGRIEDYISLVAVRALLFQRGKDLIGADASAIHGTAVWCLTSGETNSVNYHIDYAELYRYETNIIHPPLYAGTCHLSPVSGPSDMVGGDFRANVRGLDHYRQHGYKGRLSGPDGLAEDASSSDWVTAPYRRNRGILHDGDFPHLSTPISHLRPGLKRVILGFNCFTDELSECNSRAPEHSDAFNRTVKLYQAMSSAGVSVTAMPASGKYAADELPPAEASGGAGVVSAEGGEKRPAAKSGGVNIKDLLKNPALSRLIVLAAKKVKEEEAAKEGGKQD